MKELFVKLTFVYKYFSNFVWSPSGTTCGNFKVGTEGTASENSETRLPDEESVATGHNRVRM